MKENQKDRTDKLFDLGSGEGVGVFNIGGGSSPMQLSNMLDTTEIIEDEDENLIDDSSGYKMPIVPSDTYEEDDEEEDDEEENDEGKEPLPKKKSNKSQASTESDDDDEEEDDEEEEEDDDDFSSPVSILASSLKKDGLLPEDFDTKSKDLTASQLKQALKDYIWEEFEDERDDYLKASGFNDQTIQFIDFLSKGGDPKALQEVMGNRRLSQVDIKSETDEARANRKSLVLAMYRDKGVTDKRAASLYNTLVSEGEDLQEAQDAQAYFAQKEHKILEADAQRRAYEEKKAEEDKALYESTVKETIQSNDFYVNKLSAKEQQELTKALFTPTESYTYVDQEGKKRTTQITKYQAKMLEYNKDIKKQLLFAKLLMEDFSLVGFKNKVTKEVDDELDELLSGKKKKTKKVSRGNNDALFAAFDIPSYNK